MFDNNADGYAIFHLGDILKNKQLQKTLKVSVNKYKRVHPHCDSKLLIKTFVKDLNLRKHLFNFDIQNVINAIEKTTDYSISNLIEQFKKLCLINNSDVQIKKELKRIIHFLKIQKNIKGAN